MSRRRYRSPGFAPARPALAAVAMLAVATASTVGCKRDGEHSDVPRSSLVLDGKIRIQPAPEHLRGRVALPAGGRLYTRPTFSSPAYVLTLPEPPLTAGEAPPRARALRVVGVVAPAAGELSNVGNFVAVTNDLVGESEAPVGGCGHPISGLGHLRMLLYIPEVHLAEVSTRALTLVPFPGPDRNGDARERVRLGAGVRLGAPLPDHGLPTPPAGARWRWIDADGVRVLVPVPDDAVGLAWDPGLGPEADHDPGDHHGDLGEALVRDAEGSVLWLRDDGGPTVELTLRNDCGEHWSRVDGAREVENLRALALETFYEQHPPAESPPAIEPEADFRVAAGTPLRWPDGDLAGEVLASWSVAIGVGQTWDDRRCFDLPLGGELLPLDAPALACFDPDALEPLHDGVSFERRAILERGGSIVLGPAVVLDDSNGDSSWDESSLRTILNGHHDTVAECLRPLIMSEEALIAARWELRLTVREDGRLDDATVEALGASSPGVEDCLRAEAFTWQLPPIAGELLVPVTLGPWGEGKRPHGDDPSEYGEGEDGEGEDGESEDGESEDEDAGEGEAKEAPPRERESGKVFIIRDDDEDLEELGDRPE